MRLDEQNLFILISMLTSPKTILKIQTKDYVDSLHENNRNRRFLSTVFNDQDDEFDHSKLTEFDSITINRNPSSDNEVSTRKYVVDSIGEGTILRFNQTLQSYLKVCVGNDVYILTK